MMSTPRIDEERRVGSGAMDLRLAFGTGQRRPQIDEIVTEDPEADPALHARVAFVATAGESMAPLQQTDPPFTTRPPFLGLFEPAFLLGSSPRWSPPQLGSESMRSSFRISVERRSSSSNRSAVSRSEHRRYDEHPFRARSIRRGACTLVPITVSRQISN